MSTARRVGLIIVALLGVLDILSPFIFNSGSGPSGGDNGPPNWVNWLDALCGLITLVGVVLIWRGIRVGLAKALITVTRILSVASSIPAYFFGAPGTILIPVTIFIILTIIGLVLLLRRERSRVNA